MKMVIQDLAKGGTIVEEVPAPATRSGHLLIQTQRTLISAGTERMLVEFGRANFLDKARQQPDKVRQVLDKVKTDGLFTTLEAVRAKLDQPLPMGYSNVGIVTTVGDGVSGFRVGDRVVCNGNHAEFVCVPKNLCAKIPDDVDNETAAFTVLGAIALQGIRLIQPTLGERIFVSGLGLIGLMAVQILRANGCRVLGADFDPAKLALARQMGAETVDLAAGEDPERAAETFSGAQGVDAVLVTASTKSSDPISQAAHMCRKRGRIVLVGVTGLELNRADFYEKELSFQVSCSYGPGRYDPDYEKSGHDYPLGYVRWTEQRNFEAVLDLMASGAIKIDTMISRRYEIAEAHQAYDALANDGSLLGIVLQYPVPAPEHVVARRINLAPAERKSGPVVVGAIGSGNYAGRILLPAFTKTPARLKVIASAAGLSSTTTGKKLGFEQSATDIDAILSDPEINTVVIGTQHNAHARQVIGALEAGKNVFVEKPLALTLEEIDAIEAGYRKAAVSDRPPLLMVGFNRRFSPLSQRIKTEIAKCRDPIALVYTCNAGTIPAVHWTQDPAVGGGRIIGEACHFIDLARGFAGAPIANSEIVALEVGGEVGCCDTVSLLLTFANGAIATVHYFANGDKGFPKERVEVFQGGRILQLDNFRVLRGWGTRGLKKISLWGQDKGQNACVAAFVDAIAKGAPAPISPDEVFEVARIAVELSARARVAKK